MITYIIIGITALVSIVAFSSESLMNKLQFNAALVFHRNQYYRLFSHAFIHANWAHLLVNMMVLYFFGRPVEMYFDYFFGERGTVYFLLLYFGGILVSNAWALIKNKNNYYYNAVGASGAVSAVLFSFVFFNPWEPLYLFGLVRIPGILFAAGYLIYSYFMTHRKYDNVAHDAHFLGSVFGFLLPIILNPALFDRFLDKLMKLI
jgi:membrane associated rhomboid family serine protease